IHPTASGALIRLVMYADSCTAPGKSALGKRVTNMLTRFSAREEKDVAKNKNERLQEYGADTRGCNDAVYAMLPDTLAFYRRMLTLRFRPIDVAEDYELAVFVNDRGGYPFFHTPLEKRGFVLPDSVLQRLDTGAVYYYVVTRNGQEYCQRKKILRISDYAMTGLREQIANGVGFRQHSPADKRAVKGYFFEKTHLLAEAAACYSDALQKDPGNVLAILGN